MSGKFAQIQHANYFTLSLQSSVHYPLIFKTGRGRRSTSVPLRYCKSAWVFSTQFNIPAGTSASSSSSRALIVAASARFLTRAASPLASASSRRLACSSTSAAHSASAALLQAASATPAGGACIEGLGLRSVGWLWLRPPLPSSGPSQSPVRSPSPLSSRRSGGRSGGTEAVVSAAPCAERGWPRLAGSGALPGGGRVRRACGGSGGRSRGNMGGRTVGRFWYA